MVDKFEIHTRSKLHSLLKEESFKNALKTTQI